MINLPETAIGYVRVSSSLQDNGKDVGRQIEKLRAWSEANGVHVEPIYEDVASAVGPRNLEGRPEFLQAVREALSAGVPLVVSDVSRVSRDLGTLLTVVIQEGLTVISVEDGGVVPNAVLMTKVEASAEVARRISEGTKTALAKGARVSSPVTREARQRAARKSSLVRIRKKMDVLDKAVDLLEAHPGLIGQTSQVIADRLNEAGILTGLKREWSAAAVRKQKQAFMGELEFRQSERESGHNVGDPNEFNEGHQAERDVEATQRRVDPNPPLIERSNRGHQGDLSQDELDHQEMLRSPLYGMF